MIKGKAECIEYYADLLNNIEDITNAEISNIPTIIKMRYYVAVPYKELPFNKKNIYTRDNYTCQYCGKQTETLTLDHVFPKSRGGKYTWENIVACCPECNQKKADRTPEEAGMKLLREPVRPSDFMEFEFQKCTTKETEDWKRFLAS